MPQALANSLIAKSEGNVGVLETLLSLDPGTLGVNPVRIDIAAPAGLRMPSGNELGANNFWVPGGYTHGGIPEATIDPAKLGTFIVATILAKKSREIKIERDFFFRFWSGNHKA